MTCYHRVAMHTCTSLFSSEANIFIYFWQKRFFGKFSKTLIRGSEEALNISVSIIMTAAIHRELFTQLKSLYPAASLKMNNYFSCKNEAGNVKKHRKHTFINLRMRCIYSNVLKLQYALSSTSKFKSSPLLIPRRGQGWWDTRPLERTWFWPHALFCYLTKWADASCCSSGCGPSVSQEPRHTRQLFVASDNLNLWLVKLPIWVKAIVNK